MRKKARIGSRRINQALAHDPEKLADFSDKIMRPDKEKHDPEKLADFSEGIMRHNKEKWSAIDSI